MDLRERAIRAIADTSRYDASTEAREVDAACALAVLESEGLSITEGLQWDPEEQVIIDHIAAAMRGIQGWGLRANNSEFVTHIHGLQLFVAIHAMARIGFKDTSIWYTSQMDNEEVKSMHNEETPAAEPERENMEDERPAEPGTVGDNLEDVAPDAEPQDGDAEE